MCSTSVTSHVKDIASFKALTPSVHPLAFEIIANCVLYTSQLVFPSSVDSLRDTEEAGRGTNLFPKARRFLEVFFSL
ncbi:hypothetical protein TNCV_4362411 [Trichonephila clavipes]|nr:hypothetical protein TNCV_4362411 [Trichonephila clavipes]